MLISTCRLDTLAHQLTQAWHPTPIPILSPMPLNASTLLLHLTLATTIMTAAGMRLMEVTLHYHHTLEMSWATGVLALWKCPHHHRQQLQEPRRPTSQNHEIDTALRVIITLATADLTAAG